VGLLLAEGGSRLAFRKNLSALAFSQSDLYYFTAPDGVRHHIPGKTGYERLWNDQGKAEFRINALGFRGSEVQLPKPAGRFRLLFVGDSITLGGRLPEAAAFVSRVGSALRAQSDRYETVNAGMGDIGLAEEEEILRGAGLPTRPDLVVLCWYLNDGRPPVGFPEEVVYRDPVLRRLRGSPWLRRSYLLAMLYDSLQRRRVVRGLQQDGQDHRFDWIPAYRSGAWAKDPEAFRAMVAAARFDWGDAWDPASRESMFARIRRMRREAEAAGARFAVVLLPLHAQVYAPFPFAAEPQQAFSGFCGGEGLPCLDLLPVLRRHAAESPFYDQCHYTPDGNRLVADAILGFLKAKGLLVVSRGA